MPEALLLVEDRAALREALARALTPHFRVETIADGAVACARLRTESYAVVVTDVRLPGADGHAILATARTLEAPPEVVLMTGYAEVADAVAALRAGAYDYLAKPVDTEHLVRLALRAAERHALVQRTRFLESHAQTGESSIVGTSSAANELRRQARHLAGLDVPVLVHGEPGAGKRGVAQEIARLSEGASTPAELDAAALDLTTAERLWDAAQPQAAATSGGPARTVVVLVNVEGLRPEVQGFLEARLATGGGPRVIATTREDLAQRAAGGRFHADLAWRLRVATIEVPPLRARAEDLPVLAATLLHGASARFGTPARRLSPDALALLEAHAWPDNLRELRHAIEHAAVRCEGPVLEAHHLPDTLRAHVDATRAGTYRAARERGADLAGRTYLVALLERLHGNVTRAAAEAGMERESLHRALRAHGIDPARYRAREIPPPSQH